MRALVVACIIGLALSTSLEVAANIMKKKLEQHTVKKEELNAVFGEVINCIIINSHLQ